MYNQTEKTGKSVFVSLMLSFLFITAANSIAQNNAFEEINQEVWKELYKSFEELDYEKVKEKHSKDLIRIEVDNGTIIGIGAYLDMVKNWYEGSAEANAKHEMSWRFTERIYDSNFVSEKGIYKFVLDANKVNKQVFYKEFHYILRKEEEGWKIIVDYDTSRNKTIGKEDFEKGVEMDDLSVCVVNE